MPQAAGPPAEGSHRLGALARVGHDNAYHALAGRHEGIVRQAADVALAKDRDSRYATRPGLVHGHAHRPLGDHVAEAPVAIYAGSVGGLAGHLEGSAGHDVSLANTVYVYGNLDHPVGVVAHQIGLHQVKGDRIGLLFAGTHSLEDMIAHLPQIFVGENRHRPTPYSTSAPALGAGQSL